MLNTIERAMRRAQKHLGAVYEEEQHNKPIWGFILDFNK